MRVAIVSDAWHPQVNGVVRSLENVLLFLRSWGHEILLITPDQFKNMPMPGYDEIRLSLFSRRKVARMLDDFQPDAIHIAVEGPLGRNARRYCLQRKFCFTTAYHTKFPEILRKFTGAPLYLGYKAMRRFHDPSSALMVATHSLWEDLEARGFKNLVFWTRGVDPVQFSPGDKNLLDLPRPIWLCVGRVSPEKNLRAFLDLDLPGTMVIVGGGPLLQELKADYPTVHFAGPKFGDELRDYYRMADVFVFPSLSDTFGLVILEALACGVPVAAFPVTGPKDILTSEVGCMDLDLQVACLKALQLSPEACRQFALPRTQEYSARQFFNNLVLCKDGRLLRKAS